MSTTTLATQSTKRPINPTTKRPPAFIPRSYHVLLVECSERTSLITNELKAHYLNVNTGRVEHTCIFQTKQFYHLYFTPSRHFPGYSYIQKYKGWGRFSCSCSEHLKLGYCQHIEELEGAHTPHTLVEVM